MVIILTRFFLLFKYITLRSKFYHPKTRENRDWHGRIICYNRFIETEVPVRCPAGTMVRQGAFYRVSYILLLPFCKYLNRSILIVMISIRVYPVAGINWFQRPDMAGIYEFLMVGFILMISRIFLFFENADPSKVCVM